MIDRLWFKPETITALQREMRRAIDKHGIEETPLCVDDNNSLTITVEELGECARAMTYDEGDKTKLAAEALQLAAMGLAWYQRLVAEAHR